MERDDVFRISGPLVELVGGLVAENGEEPDDGDGDERGRKKCFAFGLEALRLFGEDRIQYMSWTAIGSSCGDKPLRENPSVKKAI